MRHQLGAKAKDKVTGFKGILVSNYLFNWLRSVRNCT
jgi:hypothetical protein